MNKKIISGVLACAMMCSVFATAACGESDPNGNATVIEPGTVITDEKIQSDIYGAITETELGGITYSAGVNLSVTAGAKTQSQTFDVEGAARFDKSFEADVFGLISGTDGTEQVNQYLLLFLRDGALYTAMGDGKTDVAGLKTKLKAEEDPIILSKGELIPVQEYMKSPVLMKVCKNLATLTNGVITKTEGGYSLEYDVFNAAHELISGAEGLITAIEANMNMTATAFFGQSFVKDTMQKLLKGVTAKELYDLVAPMLPEQVKEALPEAGSAEAYAYLETLLRSGTFYTALTGGEEPWSEWQTFGAVPVKELVSILTGGQIDLGSLNLKDMFSGFSKGMEGVLVNLLTKVVGLDGAVSNANVDFTVEFSFDDDKNLLGFSLDGLASGTVTPEEGEDGDGDVQPTAAEGASTVRATLKLEATVVSSPELFSLKGCKYRGEDGTSTISK